MEKKRITFKVFRFNPAVDDLPHYESYVMEVKKDALVLDILNRIKWEFDGSFTYRRSCRHGICGSCSIRVNGKVVLSCKENVFELTDIFGDLLVLEPQNKQKVIKDMVIDRVDFWNKYTEVKPFLVAKYDEHPEVEARVSPDEASLMLDSDICIQCANCYSVCPSVRVNEKYYGPAAFVKAYRFIVDTRDHNKKERIDIINEPEKGVWDCVKCYKCAEVCPKGVNPIEKITLLHNQVFKEGRAKNNVATRHAIGFKKSIQKNGFLDEGFLVRYSEGIFGTMKHLREAFDMFRRGKIKMPWNMPSKPKKMNEIKQLIKVASKIECRRKW